MLLQTVIIITELCSPIRQDLVKRVGRLHSVEVEDGLMRVMCRARIMMVGLFLQALIKKINRRHLISLTVFDAPTENGRQGASVQEMIDLAGTPYYNPIGGIKMERSEM